MKILIKGNFKSFCRVKIKKSTPKTNVVLLYLHGLYGNSLKKNSKAFVLENSIHKKELAHTVLFSSSRDWVEYNKKEKNCEFQSFKDKTFKQEEDDIGDVINFICEFKEEIFNIKENLKIIVVANSIAGTIVTNIAFKFEEIKSIILCGSGTGSDFSTKPILSTKPSIKKLFKNASKYKGEVFLLRGTLDDVVPRSSGKKLLSGFNNKKRHLIEIEGVNHNFSLLHGFKTKKAVKLYVENIIKIVRLV